jgi:hypothetical protein
VALFLVGLRGDRHGGCSVAGLVLEGGGGTGHLATRSLDLRVAAPLRGAMPVVARPEGDGACTGLVAGPSLPHAGRGWSVAPESRATQWPCSSSYVAPRVRPDLLVVTDDTIISS